MSNINSIASVVADPHKIPCSLYLLHNRPPLINICSLLPGLNWTELSWAELSCGTESIPTNQFSSATASHLHTCKIRGNLTFTEGLKNLSNECLDGNWWKALGLCRKEVLTLNIYTRICTCMYPRIAIYYAASHLIMSYTWAPFFFPWIPEDRWYTPFNSFFVPSTVSCVSDAENQIPNQLLHMK